MKDKRPKDRFGHTSDPELRFTEEDRSKVFEQVHKLENTHTKKKSIVSYMLPLTASVFVAALCLFLFFPSIFSGTPNHEDAAGPSANREDPVSTILFTVKDDHNRIPVNLLLSYRKDKKMINTLSIPRDTYAPISGQDDGTPSYDKLTFAYERNSGGAENVRSTVSELFDLPIDHYAIMDLETFSSIIDSTGGIEYELRDDIRVRAISKVSFEFKKGMNRFNGEEVAALLMDAAAGKSLNAQDQSAILNAVIQQLSAVPKTQLEPVLLKEIEGNISIGQLLEDRTELPSIRSVSLLNGIKDETIDGAYYITFEEDFLKSVSKDFTSFD